MSQKSYDDSCSLYLIPTPIGNLDDITVRSIKVLNIVEVLFCEDTRITRNLLNHFEIKKKLIVSNEHNEEKNIKVALDYLNKGFNIGIVTDRGTPIISDPGYKITCEVIKNGFNVIPLPGANALIPALISSGLAPHPFMFYGFLNSKKSKREEELEYLKECNWSIIFYEAPHRIIDMLVSLKNIFGNRNISVARELTKIHEEIYRGTIDNVINQLSENEIKGEFVIVVDGYYDINKCDDISICDHVNKYVNEGYSEKDAMKLVAKDRNVSKSSIYKEYISERK